MIEELQSMTSSQQAEPLADFFSKTRNNFKQIDVSDFSEFLSSNETSDFSDILMEPTKIPTVRKTMNIKLNNSWWYPNKDFEPILSLYFSSPHTHNQLSLWTKEISIHLEDRSDNSNSKMLSTF